MGKEAAPSLPGSPYPISFRTDVKEGNPAVTPFNSSVIACSDPSFECSCGDCPLVNSCAEPNPPAPSETKGCHVQIAGSQVFIEGFLFSCCIGVLTCESDCLWY